VKKYEMKAMWQHQSIENTAIECFLEFKKGSDYGKEKTGKERKLWL
jgi:hypothetical protein